MSDTPAAKELRRTPALATTPWLQPLPPVSRCILQADPAALELAARALGLGADVGAGGGVAHATGALLWLGPDERLLLGNTDEPSSSTLAPALAATLAPALDGLTYSLIDVSHRQIGLRLRAPFAAALLNCACPQDLDAEAFPPGLCSRTLYGKAEIVLWRLEVEEFRIEVWRSYADYLTESLVEAAKDLER